MEDALYSPPCKGGAGGGCERSERRLSGTRLGFAVATHPQPLPCREGSPLTRARVLVGTRFRPHGRDAATGLDCVGLAGLAMAVDHLPTGYALRGGSADAVAASIDATGLVRCPPGPGILALTESGPDQLHLVILTAEGFIHADAGRRRVVERRGDPPWPVLGCWQPIPLPSGEGGSANGAEG